jgi:hypothetical protein
MLCVAKTSSPYTQFLNPANLASIKAIFQKTAFAGFGWRVALIVTATTVMPFVQEKLNSAIEQSKK